MAGLRRFGAMVWPVRCRSRAPPAPAPRRPARLRPAIARRRRAAPARIPYRYVAADEGYPAVWDARRGAAPSPRKPGRRPHGPETPWGVFF